MRDDATLDTSVVMHFSFETNFLKLLFLHVVLLCGLDTILLFTRVEADVFLDAISDDGFCVKLILSTTTNIRKVNIIKINIMRLIKHRRSIKLNFNDNMLTFL